MHIVDLLADMAASDNLPAVIPRTQWAAPKTSLFEGNNGQLMVVKLPYRQVGPDPIPADVFAAAWRTRNAGLVWDLVERSKVE